MANTKITTSVISADAITGALIADDVVLGGNPTTSTQSASDNSTKIATTAYVTTAIDNLVDSAPGTMNTLNEIAAALNDDANFNTTVTNLIAAKAPLASPSFTGDVGIGETSPDVSLHISEGGEPPAEGMLILEANSSSRQLRIQPPTNSDNGWIDYRGGNLLFLDDGTEVARFQGSTAFSVSNKIGIGTASPASLLHLKSTATGSTPTIIFENTNNAQTMNIDYYNNAGAVQSRISYDEGPAAFSFRPNVNSTSVYMAYDGTVGIGNTNPGGMHSNANKLVVGTGSGDQGMSVYAGTSVGRYAFARALGNNTDAYDGGISYNGDRDLKFHTNAGAERLRINGSGNIGFGTTNMPAGMSSSSYKQFKIGGAVLADSGHSSGHNVYLANNLYSGASNDLKFTHSAAAALIQMTGGKIYLRTHDGGGASADATATVNQRMQIHNNGHVAIGDHSPVGMLDIKGGGYNSIIIGSNRTDNTNKLSGISAYMYTNNQVSLFQNFNQNGSNALYVGSADGAYRGLQAIYFMTNSNYNATSSHKTRYLINGNGSHKWYGDHQGDTVGHFVFSNQNGADSDSTNCTLMVRNGRCQIQIMSWSTLGARVGTRGGGWSQSGTNACYLTSNDASNIILNTNGSPTLASGTAITSDERLKKNITDIADGQLAKINALKPRNFEWKDERKAGNQEGFIAQEVESVMPEAVEERASAPDPDDTSRDFEGDIKVLKHEVINARLIKAVQELSAKLEAAEARITTLEG